MVIGQEPLWRVITEFMAENFPQIRCAELQTPTCCGGWSRQGLDYRNWGRISHGRLTGTVIQAEAIFSNWGEEALSAGTHFHFTSYVVAALKADEKPSSI